MKILFVSMLITPFFVAAQQDMSGSTESDLIYLGRTTSQATKEREKTEAKGTRLLFEDLPNWRSVQESAKDQGKYIFLDCSATWCGPCKMMDRDVFSQDNVVNFMKRNFISVHIQMDSTKNDKDFVKNWRTDAHQLMIDNKI